MSADGRFLQNAKAKVFKRLLAPAGFVKADRIYVRKAGGQIHAINFQTATWGGRYFVNVGFHYDFLPGLMAMANLVELEYTRFRLLELLMYARLQALMPAPYPREWPYGIDVPDTEANLAANAQNAISAIDEFGKKWRDPADFMRALPPELLEREMQELERRKTLPSQQIASRPPFPVDAVLGVGWHMDPFNLRYSLGVIAHRLRQDALAEAYCASAKLYSNTVGENRAIKELGAQIQTSV